MNRPNRKGGAAPRQENAPSVFHCDHNHIKNICRELRHAGLDLKTTGTETQCKTLLRALQFLGPRGLGTFEGTAAGYVRLATRVQELEADGWLIASERESLIGPDGLFHAGCARYILVGRRSDMPPAQLDLGLEGA